jgi:uncharacterized membrane protein
MDEWLALVAKNVDTVIDAMALMTIVIGTIVVVFAGIPAMLRPSATDKQVRHIWLRYARWLVAGLTLQLAADIIRTSIAPSWEDIGQVAAIAVIRTFLDYFLVRDLSEMHLREPD